MDAHHGTRCRVHLLSASYSQRYSTYIPLSKYGSFIHSMNRIMIKKTLIRDAFPTQLITKIIWIYVFYLYVFLTWWHRNYSLGCDTPDCVGKISGLSSGEAKILVSCQTGTSTLALPSSTRPPEKVRKKNIVIRNSCNSWRQKIFPSTCCFLREWMISDPGNAQELFTAMTLVFLYFWQWLHGRF